MSVLTGIYLIVVTKLILTALGRAGSNIIKSREKVLMKRRKFIRNLKRQARRELMKNRKIRNRNDQALDVESLNEDLIKQFISQLKSQGDKNGYSEHERGEVGSCRDP